MNYKHFSNISCEYYPCHGLDDQNCLFCFCPLYFFENCEGNPKDHKGIKDCSDCVANHDAGSYEHVRRVMDKAFQQATKTGQMPYLPLEEK